MLTIRRVPFLSLLFRNTNKFCKNIITKQEKLEILKTYLEVIPPHRLHQIMDQDKMDLSEFTALDRPLEEAQLRAAWKKIKSNVHLIPIQKLTLMMETVSKGKEKNQTELKLVKKIQNRIIGIFRKKIHYLSLDNLINFVYKMVKLNVKQFEIMKEVERIIIEEKIKVDYPQIRKILWAYTHLDVGSAVLYSHIAKTIRIGQHELSPLELAESAYMLSKVSENATGGFGVFQIAQKHVQNHLSRLGFHDLVKAASYLLTQNIGSNQFQIKLEEQIYKKFPDRASLRINQLVDLLKSTATYYFKFKQNALLHMLKASTQRLAPHASLEQFQDIIWSWGRSGKGDKEMWLILEQCVSEKFLNQLKPRQIAFFYYSLSCSEHSTLGVLQKLENRFMTLLEEKTNEHYLVKMLLGMQKRKDYSNECFLKIALSISERIPRLSNKQIIAFAKTMNESDFHFQNKKDSIKEIEQSLERVSAAILNKIYMFGPHELVELLYLWIKLDIPDKNGKFVNVIFRQLDADLLDIPKPAFIKAMFCFTIRDHYQETLRMVPILYQLMKYGPLGYFFSPYETPLMAYCILHLSANSGGSARIHPKLVEDMKTCLEETNPAILNEFVRKGYEQAVNLGKKL